MAEMDGEEEFVDAADEGGVIRDSGIERRRRTRV